MIPTTHYANIKRGSFDPTYKWQYCFNIREAGADWLDFVSYCSSFPEHKQLYVYRVDRKDIKTELEQIETRLKEFEEIVSDIMDDIGRIAA